MPPCFQGESAHEGGADKLIFLTRSTTGLASAQERMVSLEVCRRRMTLRCASWRSSGCHQTLASKAEKVLATARCRRARHLVVGPPPRCGRSVNLGERSHREAAMKLYSLVRAEVFLSRGSKGAPTVAERGQAPCLISKMIQSSNQAVPCAPRGRGAIWRDCQKGPEVGAKAFRPLPAGGPKRSRPKLKERDRGTTFVPALS